MLEKKSFVMSMFVNAEALYKAKAEYYEAEAERLEMVLVVAQEALGHLEVTTLRLDNENKKLSESLDRMSETINRMEF